ncbi:MAG: hypothetical protein JWQ21_3723 [Herminiimonas sp.]|nr:hypothetical protein [Herminiimonas sp.]
MVLEMKIPHGTDFDALWPLWPVFLSYISSFVYIGIYWNNHHHMLHAAQRVNGSIMWANSHLLSWLSLVPFATGWMGENHFAPVSTALYGVVVRHAPIYGFCRLLEGDCRVADARQGTTLAAPGALHSPPINSADRFATRKWKRDELVVLLMAAIAYWILQRALMREHGNDALLTKAVGVDLKGKLSPLLYLIAIIFTFFQKWIAQALYVLVALLWLLPAPRIERTVRRQG